MRRKSRGWEERNGGGDDGGVEGGGYGCVNQYFIAEDESITALCLIYASHCGWGFLLRWAGAAPRRAAEEPFIRPGETGDRARPGLPRPLTAHLLNASTGPREWEGGSRSRGEPGRASRTRPEQRVNISVNG